MLGVIAMLNLLLSLYLSLDTYDYFLTLSVLLFNFLFFDRLVLCFGDQPRVVLIKVAFRLERSAVFLKKGGPVPVSFYLFCLFNTVYSKQVYKMFNINFADD